MTSEHRLLIEATDIEVVELVCKRCGASVSLKPSDLRHFMGDECPNCKEGWFEDGSKLKQAANALFGSLRTLSDMQQELKVRVRMHIGIRKERIEDREL